MGLDMYLTAKKFIFSVGDDSSLSQGPNPLTQDLQELGIPYEIKEIQVEGAYWRKANQIHQWFVTHVQDGEDNCDSFHVEREKLVELKEICQQVLLVPALAREMLPSQEGFFFGSTDYDDWYFRDLKDTVEQIDRCLKFPEAWEFEYHASW